jgi:hypothetical protein
MVLIVQRRKAHDHLNRHGKALGKFHTHSWSKKSEEKQTKQRQGIRRKLPKPG